MKKTKEYSCVRKTKKAFENSLVELSKETAINKISVKQICEKAELSRNAFYFHYQDINALIEDVENSMVNDIASKFDHIRDVGFPDNVLTNIQDLTEYLYDNKDKTLMLIDSSYKGSFQKKLNEAYSDFFFEYFKQYHNTEIRGTFDFFYEFLSGGYCCMLVRWLRNPEEISKRHFIRLAYSFVKRLLVVDKKPELPRLSK